MGPLIPAAYRAPQPKIAIDQTNNGMVAKMCIMPQNKRYFERLAKFFDGEPRAKSLSVAIAGAANHPSPASSDVRLPPY
jgi:hypothetical protein